MPLQKGMMVELILIMLITISSSYVSGIEKVKSKFAPGMQHCYVWLDFGCLNQDTDPTAEMGGRLDRVVEFCDCLFSPIHGEDANMSLTIQNSYDDYDVVTWNGERGYTKKACCRLEMFYAANIPMKKNSTRAQNFRYGLKDRALESCRPHLLYGTSEMMKGKAPQMLPPLQNSFYDKLDPMTGSLTNEAEDRPKIQRLVDQLKPFMKVIEVGYTGDKNEDNEIHGQGKYRYSDGSVYKGKFENNKKNGRGTYKYASGSLYDGNFKDDKIHGQGIYKSPNGDKYVGTFAFGLRNGRGVYTHPGDSECNGDSIYDGEWKNSLRQGQGKQIKDGIVTHNGYWENDQPSQQKGLFSPFWG